ncbi:MAG: hypothetical protein ACSHWS_04140 [Sulfitobacter sp.]
MTLRIIWITAIVLCMLTAGLNITASKSDDQVPLFLAYEPVLAIFMAISPSPARPTPKSSPPDLGRVQFGSGDVCCPGIPARNTVNIATGEVMPIE